jgi:hypothetical protein
MSIITITHTKVAPVEFKLNEVNDHTVLATDIDRTQCRRVKDMQVLVLGLGRTGTSCNSSFLVAKQLKKTLIQFSYPQGPYHARLRPRLSYGVVYE